MALSTELGTLEVIFPPTPRRWHAATRAVAPPPSSWQPDSSGHADSRHQVCHSGGETNRAPCPRTVGVTRDTRAHGLPPRLWAQAWRPACTTLLDPSLPALSVCHHTASGMFCGHQSSDRGPVTRNSTRQLSRPSLVQPPVACASITQWALEFLQLPEASAARTGCRLLCCH